MPEPMVMPDEIIKITRDERNAFAEWYYRLYKQSIPWHFDLERWVNADPAWRNAYEYIRDTFIYPERGKATQLGRDILTRFDYFLDKEVSQGLKKDWETEAEWQKAYSQIFEQVDKSGKPIPVESIDFLTLPVYKQVQAYTEAEVKGEQPISRIVTEPGQPPRIVTTSPKEAARLQFEEAYKQQTATYLKQQAEQEKEVEEYNRYYGLQPSVTGQPTSAASIAEWQRLQPKVAAAYEEQQLQQAREKARSGYTGIPEGGVIYGSTLASRNPELTVAGRIQPQRQLQPFPDITPTVKAITGGVTPNLGKYIEANLNPALQDFDRRFPGMREQWMTALQKYEPTNWAGSMPPAYMSAGQNLQPGYSTVVGTEMGLSPAEVAKISPAENPVETYLKNYPWYKEFAELPARQRGYNPQMYAPKARGLTGL